MQISTDGPHLVFTGELDEVSIALAREALDAATADGGAVVLDLSGLTHLASIGISLLVATLRRVGADRFEIVARPGSAAGQVLEMYRVPHRSA